jgi:hypothetical protein
MVGAGMATYQGFMSDDKKTIVGTFTDGDAGSECYHLMIIQITGQTYTAGSLPAGTLSTHVVGSGAMPFWIHYTNTVDNSGVMTFSDWVASNPTIIAPVTTLTGYIDASGTVTMAGNPTFHGQVSHDSTFTVSTQTEGTGPDFFYMLSVSIRVDDAMLYATFPGTGLYKYNGSTWTQLTPYEPTAMTATGSLLYASFGNGVWQYNGSTWSQLTPYSPEAMVASGSLLYGKYPNGIWQYNGSTWTQLTPYSPTDMIVSGSLLNGKYNNGIWQYSGSTWTQLTPYSPAAMVAGGSLLYGKYPNGIWQYNGSSWSQLTPYSPEAMVAAGSLLYGKYDNGIWLYNGSTWSQVTPSNPEAMVASGSLLYGDFGSTGIWMYNGSTWTQITPNDPTSMTGN